MRWSTPMLAIVTALLLMLTGAEPATAEESRGFFRQILIMWFPLLLIVGLWIFFIRRTVGGKQAQLIERQIAMIDRYIPHMDALEKKLDRIIDLLERPREK